MGRRLEQCWRNGRPTGSLMSPVRNGGKNICEVIGCCLGRSAVKTGIEKQRRVKELLQSLTSPLYPFSRYRSKDQRPLHGHYAKSVPACTSEYVESLLNQQSHPLVELLPKKMLVRDHFELLQRLVLSVISRENSMNDAAAQRLLDYVPQLLRSAPSLPGTEPRFSTLMSLAVTILERITINKEGRFPERLFMPLLMCPLMRRLEAHRVNASRVQQIVQLALNYLQRREHAWAQLSLENKNVIDCIANYWSCAPSLFNGRLVELLHRTTP